MELLALSISSRHIQIKTHLRTQNGHPFYLHVRIGPKVDANIASRRISLFTHAHNRIRRKLSRQNNVPSSNPTRNQSQKQNQSQNQSQNRSQSQNRKRNRNQNQNQVRYRSVSYSQNQMPALHVQKACSHSPSWLCFPYSFLHTGGLIHC